MKNENFKNWLLEKGYKENTCVDYLARCVRTLKYEGYANLEQLADKIDIILPQYEAKGEKHGLGKISNSSILAALRSLKRCVSEQAVLVKAPETAPKSRFKIFA